MYISFLVISYHLWHALFVSCFFIIQGHLFICPYRSTEVRAPLSQLTLVALAPPLSDRISLLPTVHHWHRAPWNDISTAW